MVGPHWIWSSVLLELLLLNLCILDELALKCTSMFAWIKQAAP